MDERGVGPVDGPASEEARCRQNIRIKAQTYLGWLREFENKQSVQEAMQR